MKSWIEFSIKQPITVAVGVILVVLAGILSFTRVPVQMAPEVESVVIAVTTTWENSSPQEIETEVVDEQEEVLQGIAGLVAMTSLSQSGQGQIRLEFRTGTDIDDAMSEVDQKLSQVPNYPQGVDRPVIQDVDPESIDYIAWIGLASSDPEFDTTTLFDFMDKKLKPIFERIPGVSLVGILGAREREVQIRIDPVSLAQREMTIQQLYDTLLLNNENYSGGKLSEGKNDVRVRMLGRFSNIEKVKSLIIRRDESGPVYLKDVAEVVETYKERQNYVRARGHVMPFFNFQLETGANLIKTMDEVQAVCDQLNEPGALLEQHAKELGLNGILELVQTYDSTQYVHQAIGLVQSNIFIGGFLSIITLLLFLRSLRTIGIIAVAIPISVIGSIIVLVVLGRSINIVSLAGMAFAVGMVVDNAIVVIENIFRHLEMGKSVKQSSLDGAQEVSGAVVASTLTTLVVFLPVLLIQESAGQLFRDIVLAIAAAVGLSLIVSVMVIPSAASRILIKSNKKPEEKKKGFLGKLSLKNLPVFVGNFVHKLASTWSLRIVTIVSFGLVTVIGIALLLPPMDYLPKGNRNIVFGLMIPPPGYNVKQLDKLGERLEERVRPAWELTEAKFEIERVLGEDKNVKDRRVDLPLSMEEGAPTIKAPLLDHYFVVGWDGRVFHVAIVKEDKRVVDTLNLFNYATAGDQAPDTFSFSFQFPLFRTGGQTGSAINIDLTGDNLEHVSASAGALMGSLIESFGPYAIQPEPANFSLPTPEIQIVANDERLSEMGMTRQDLGLIIRAYGDGLFVGEYEVAGELKDLKIITHGALSDVPVEALNNALFAAPDGQVVDLASVATIKRVSQPNQIKRVNRQRAVTLQLTPPPGMTLQEAVEKIDEVVLNLRETGAIHPSVHMNQAGTAGKLNELKRAMLGDGSLVGTLSSSMFLALFVVYLTMVVLFQSWVYPFVIMVSVPLATFGGFLGLSVVHFFSELDRYMPVQNLDVLTMLGFMILAGVVVNNAILLVHQTLNFLNEDGAMHPNEAIRASVISRVRPILMSTLTSVGGMLPLVLMPGSGSELYRGLGSVVVGGLLVSTIFTLVLVPVVLSIVLEWQYGRINRSKRNQQNV